MTAVLYLASAPAALDRLIEVARATSPLAVLVHTGGCRLTAGGATLDVELATDVPAAVARTLETHFDAVLIDVDGAAPLALLDGFLAGLRAERDQERRYRRDRVLAVVGTEPARVLFDLGQRRIGGWLAAPRDRAGVEALGAQLAAAVRPPPSRKALCAAGGGITGVYYELGVLKCLEDTLGGFSVHDFDLYFGISAGAIVTSLVANRVALDELLREIDPHNRAGYGLELSLSDLNLRDLPARLYSVATHLRDYRDRVRRGEDRLSVTAALSQLAALFGPFFHGGAKQRRMAELLSRPGRTDDFRALDRELYIGATDQDSREHVLFGSEAFKHVPISRAVQASAAIHPFFSSVTIDGRRYTDGFVTKTTNLVAAVDRGANLVVIIDPFLPLVTDDPGFNHRHSLLWVLVQDYKTVAFTRYERVSAALHETHPAVTCLSFLPSNRMRRVLATNPISTSSFDPIVTQAYASTYRRLARMAYRFGPVLAEHGIDLSLELAARKVRLIEASPAPRAELLCAGALTPRVAPTATAA
ncbi:MAG TPA: patatin-like phospholipase family protein [Kofleriaceae bacterium]|nr:patatin-like phospholipase family protein [Kofleriaceae bacterium]